MITRELQNSSENSKKSQGEVFSPLFYDCKHKILLTFVNFLLLKIFFFDQVEYTSESNLVNKFKIG